MTAKSRKLAWDLVEIFSRYSDRDITDALHLLKSGELLREPLLVAHQAALFAKPNPKQSELRYSEKEIDSIEKVIRSRRIPDKDNLLDFISGVSKGKYLRDQRSMRAYAETLGILFPKKIPSRNAVARRILDILLKAPHEIRASQIDVGRTVETKESSLQEWSDLIVKRD